MGRRARRNRRPHEPVEDSLADSGEAPPTVHSPAGATPAGVYVASETLGGSIGAWVGALAVGVAAIALSAASGSLAGEFSGGLPIFFGIVAALGCSVWALAALNRAARLPDRAALVLGIAVLLVVVTPDIFAWNLEHRLFGTRANGISVAEANQHPWAVVFTFRDGRVHPELGGEADIRAGTMKQGSHVVGTAYAVPVVPEGWTPDQLVPVWAVATNRTLVAARRQWAQPAQGGVRVIGGTADDYRKAIAVAERRHHLHAAFDSVLVQWTGDPAAVQAEAWREMTRIVAAASGFWIALMLVALVMGGGPTAARRPRRV